MIFFVRIAVQSYERQAIIPSLVITNDHSLYHFGGFYLHHSFCYWESQLNSFFKIV